MNTNEYELGDHDFMQRLMKNELTTPNEMTEAMGKLIRSAREDLGLTQSELAKEMGNRPATISDIENGKSEIGIFTLVKFAIILRKEFSYFFPESIFKDRILGLRSPFEHEVLNYAGAIEAFGDPDLTLRLLKFLASYFHEINENEA